MFKYSRFYDYVYIYILHTFLAQYHTNERNYRYILQLGIYHQVRNQGNLFSEAILISL